MNDLVFSLYDKIKELDEPRENTLPSGSMIAKCPREQYFTLTGKEPINKLTAAKLLRFKVGHGIEDEVRPYLKELYSNMKFNERLMSEDMNFTGEYDCYDPDSKLLLDVKSVHPFAFKYLEKDPKIHLHYQYQLHAYRLLLEEHGNEVDKLGVLYVSLDGRLMYLEQEPDEAITKNVKKRIQLITEALEKDEPPECICLNKDHPLYKGQMRFCVFYNSQDKVCCEVN